MAIPQNSDMTYYTATPLTNTDWANNFHQVVLYLTTTYDCTFKTLTTSGAITAGGTITGSALVGDGSGITNIGGKFYDRGDNAATDLTEATMTMDANWHNWDISATVPTGATAVVLNVQVRTTPSTNAVLGIRTSGYTNDLNAGWIVTQVAGINNYADMIIPLPAADTRILQYYASTTFQAIGLNIKGWYK